MIVERFAPSPTGLLHLGHGFSALTAYGAARAAGGRFLLRIEDTDTTRCSPEYEAAIYEDLAWLGLEWEQPVWRQSERGPAYREALDDLQDRGLIYPCTCTRKEIAAARADLPLAPPGPDGIPYPGTCRSGPKHPDRPAALRLNMAAAVAAVRDDLTWEEVGASTQRLDPDALIHGCGDVVLWRKDTQTAAYHLAVVVDDAAQGVTHLTRGQDVAPATPIHRLLQALLGLPTPVYRHHRLITDDAGKRLAKSYDSKALSKFRMDGLSPNDIRQMVGLPKR